MSRTCSLDKERRDKWIRLLKSNLVPDFGDHHSVFANMRGSRVSVKWGRKTRFGEIFSIDLSTLHVTGLGVSEDIPWDKVREITFSFTEPPSEELRSRQLKALRRR